MPLPNRLMIDATPGSASAGWSHAAIRVGCPNREAKRCVVVQNRAARRRQCRLARRGWQTERQITRRLPRRGRYLPHLQSQRLAVQRRTFSQVVLDRKAQDSHGSCGDFRQFYHATLGDCAEWSWQSQLPWPERGKGPQKRAARASKPPNRGIRTQRPGATSPGEPNSAAG
jgi:hypothetical protein